MTAESCSSCRFFRAQTRRDDHMGECVRNPPQLVSITKTYEHEGNVGTEVATCWPDVREDQWCGEWTTKARAA